MKRAFSMKSGFTIVELIVVIVVIGILAGLTIFGYNGIQTEARDKTLTIDIENVKSRIDRYAVNNGGKYDSAIDWNSATGDNPNIPFTPNEGNVIVVTGYGDSYCIKGFNPRSNNKTINQAKTAASGDYACQTGFTQISTGGAYNYNAAHTCGISTSKKLYCWGVNTYGQLGDNSLTSRSAPVAIEQSSLPSLEVKQVAVGGAHTCVIGSDDLPYCWGRNDVGQLGNGMLDGSNRMPGYVALNGALAGKTVKQIVAGSRSTCVIASDDKLYCWGHNTSGSTTPVLMGGALTGKKILSVSLSEEDNLISTDPSQSVTCAIDTDRVAYCWGYNYYGNLGNGTTTSTSVPATMAMTGALAGKVLVSISASVLNTCAIANDFRAYCWGAAGTLGDGTNTASSVPVAVSTSGVLAGKSLKTIDTSYGHACALATDRNAYCWGRNTSGQLGNNSTTNALSPVMAILPGGVATEGFTNIATGYEYSCGVAKDKSAFCWGESMNGRLGTGSIGSDALVPVLVQQSASFQ